MTNGLEMDGDKGWILKILTGPHVGSEAALSAGVYLMGRGENCDIILHDNSLAEQHFQLSLDADKIGLSILAEDYPCYVDGEEVDANSVEIKPYQVISAGTFFFTLGSAQEAWPPIELLGVGRNFKQAEAKPTEETPEDSNPQPPASSASSPIAMMWQRLWRINHPAGRIYLSVGIAIIGIGLSLLFIVLTTADIPEENLQTQDAEIHQIIKNHIVDATVRTVSENGKKVLHIHGYTDTDAQREAFMEALGKAKITAQTQIYSAERLKLAVSVILGQLLNPKTDKVEVSGVSGFPGKVALSGYVAQGETWKRALDVIRNDVQGLQGHDSQVRTMDDAVEELKQMLAAQGFADTVNIDIDDYTIYLIWQELGDDEQQKLTALSEEFRKKFANQPPLADAKQVKPKINKFELDVDIQSVSFGKLPYLETHEGKRYTIGASLGDYTIKEISREFILLSKDGELGRYYFNAKPTMPDFP